MRKRFGLAVAVLVATSCIWASGASAATEVGSNCAANSGVPNYTLLQLSQAGSPLPLAAPAAGVVTKWKVNSAIPIPPEITVSETMRVFRATGAANEFQTIAESSPGVIRTGQNTFETRIPVQAGDRFGAYTPAAGIAVLFCSTGNPEDKIGAKEADVAPGGKATYTPVENIQLALSVTIEPDADNDGFGDETQDKCPQSAASQAACPVIALSTSSIAKKGQVTVLVTASSQASVTVAGTAKLGKGKTATLKGGTQTLAPAVISKFTLPFSKKLKSKLKHLSRKQSLTLKVTATAPNIVGLPTVSTLKVKLKGQAKPKK